MANRMEAAMALEIRLSLQRLLIGLVVVIVPLSILGLYLTSESNGNLRQAVGGHLRTIARTDGVVASQFIEDRIADVSAVAAEPAVLEAIQAANRSREHVSNEVISARIEKIEQQWGTGQADSRLKEILSSRASTWLRSQRNTNPRLLKVIVADENGVTVAATDKPLHYAQAGEGYWPAVYAQGRGAVNVTDVRFDEQAKSHYIGIGIPVLEGDSGRFVGAVSALADVSGLFALLSREHIGRTGHILLVKDDGTVVSGPDVSPDMKYKSEEFAAVRDALGTLEGRQAAYIVAPMKNGPRIVGFADTSLKQNYPNLNWLVLASQDEQEAMSPVRTLDHFAFLMVVLGLLMLTLLVVYFFLHREEPLEQVRVAETLEPPKGKAMSA
jgi:Cache domain